MTDNHKPPLFPLGQVVATPGALEALAESGDTAACLLRRHVRGDWGDLCEEDRRLNDEALVDGSRIFSAYRIGKAQRTVWIITEAEPRSSTCILLPEEY